MMNFKHTKLAVSAAAFAAAGALVAPQASAGDRAAQASDAKVRALEAQMNQMRDMMSQMQADLARAKAEPAPAPVIQEVKEEEHHDNTIFFRGGYARNDTTRNGVSIFSDVAGSSLGLPGGQPDKDAWYFGAGFDFGLTDDAWGLMDETQVLAELMFEYKSFDDNTEGNVLVQEPTGLATGNFGADIRTVHVNQFTLTASPKVKFMKSSDFRPWIIPIGFAMHVVSPPSESITVLNPGMMFGAGADYRIWKDFFLGADARYHLTSSDADGVDTDGFTAGGYVGIGF